MLLQVMKSMNDTQNSKQKEDIFLDTLYILF